MSTNLPPDLKASGRNLLRYFPTKPDNRSEESWNTNTVNEPLLSVASEASSTPQRPVLRSWKNSTDSSESAISISSGGSSVRGLVSDFVLTPASSALPTPNEDEEHIKNVQGKPIRPELRSQPAPNWPLQGESSESKLSPTYNSRSNDAVSPFDSASGFENDGCFEGAVQGRIEFLDNSLTGNISPDVQGDNSIVDVESAKREPGRPRGSRDKKRRNRRWFRKPSSTFTDETASTGLAHNITQTPTPNLKRRHHASEGSSLSDLSIKIPSTLAADTTDREEHKFAQNQLRDTKMLVLKEDYELLHKAEEKQGDLYVSPVVNGVTDANTTPKDRSILVVLSATTSVSLAEEQRISHGIEAHHVDSTRSSGCMSTPSKLMATETESTDETVCGSQQTVMPNVPGAWESAWESVPTSRANSQDPEPQSTAILPPTSHADFTDFHDPPLDPKTVDKRIYALVSRSKSSPELKMLEDGKQDPRAAGWIYVYTSPKYPGYVKIGYTNAQLPEKRIELWRNCGIPVEAVPDPSERPVKHGLVVESLIALELHAWRKKYNCEVCKKRGRKRGSNRGRKRAPSGAASAGPSMPPPDSRGEDDTPRRHQEWYFVSPETALEVMTKWRDWMVLCAPHTDEGHLKLVWKARLDEIFGERKANIGNVKWERLRQPIGFVEAQLHGWKSEIKNLKKAWNDFWPSLLVLLENSMLLYVGWKLFAKWSFVGLNLWIILGFCYKWLRWHS